MFKNLTIYRVLAGWPNVAGYEALDHDLRTARFLECGASQEKSVGWIEPRGHEHGAMVEVIGGQWLLKLMIETKTVPADVVKRKVGEQLGTIEATTGRKPGKKERREIADDVRLSLLPMAFAKQSSAQVWVDPAAGLLMVDGHNDEVITWLIKAVDGLVVQMVNTQTSPATAMAGWLATREAPQGFTVDRECELKAADESRAVVKYGRHALDTDEVQNHIAMGKIPTRLALTWGDRVSFVLTDGMQLKKIAFLESVFEGGDGGAAVDNFDADAALATGELRNLIPDLLDALGGEVRPLPALPALPGVRK